MIARTHRAVMFSAFQRMVICTVIIAGTVVLTADLFAADMATHAVVEKAVEKAAEKVAEKAAEEATEKAELTARRPDEWRGPTKVHFLVFVLDIDEIDDARQSFAANVYIQLRWKDTRLANPGGSTRQVRLDDIWNPRVLLANQQGRVATALPEIAQVNPDGTVIYRQRYTGNLSQPLDLSQFQGL